MVLVNQLLAEMDCIVRLVKQTPRIAIDHFFALHLRIEILSSIHSKGHQQNTFRKWPYFPPFFVPSLNRVMPPLLTDTGEKLSLSLSLSLFFARSLFLSLASSVGRLLSDSVGDLISSAASNEEFVITATATKKQNNPEQKKMQLRLFGTSNILRGSHLERRQFLNERVNVCLLVCSQSTPPPPKHGRLGQKSEGPAPGEVFNVTYLYFTHLHLRPFFAAIPALSQFSPLK
jgi:hypothetical protein